LLINRKKAEVDKQLAGSNITRDEAIRSRDSMEKKLEEMLADITEAKAGNKLFRGFAQIPVPGTEISEVILALLTPTNLR
jgi:hypothetical protein